MDGDLLKAFKRNAVFKRILQMSVIALAAGFIMYFAAIRVLIFYFENSLVRFAKQGAATVETYINGRLSELKSISENSIIGDTKLSLEQRMAELKKQLHLDSYRRLSIADLNGNSFTTDGVKLYVGDREYFISAKNGAPFISDPIISRADGTKIIVFSVPLIENGIISGVLYATYDADVLSMITDRIELSEGGYSFIMNRKGDIIAHKDRQILYNMSNDLEMWENTPELKRLAELGEKMIAGQKGTGVYNYCGEERYMGFYPIGETGWSIAVTAPKAVVFRELNIVFMMLLVFIMIALLTVVIVLSRSTLLKRDLIRHQMNSMRIADLTNLIALTLKRDGTILTTNRFAEDILLYFDKFGTDKVRNIYELLSEDDRSKLKDIIDNINLQYGSSSLQIAFKRGESNATHIYCSAIIDNDDNNIVKILGIDITDRVEQEARLHESFEELAGVYAELASTEETIRQLAYKDSLTGLPNRAALYNEIEKVFWGMGKPERCAMLYLDIDNFKNINDFFSHSFGDQLLVEIGKRLKNAFTSNEFIARFEGDEFIVFINKIGSAEELNKKVNTAMSVFNEPFSVFGNNIHVSASCGISIYPEHANSIEELLKSSDVAMYRAKKDGKNRHILFEHEMNNEFTERINMENGLRKAIEKNEFLLHYQPQIDLGTGKISGFEALLRWMHPEQGMIMPLKFINIAEETGLIVPIGNWVLKTACEFIKKLNDSMNSNFEISVNISVTQLMQSDFPNVVRTILKETGLRPSLLELELTESKLIETVDLNLQKLRELRKIGVKLSVDDFGKGFSSLSYLKLLPIDTLKIDKSFIDDISEDDSSMIESIIHIGHKRNLVVVAEGVEKKEQMEYLVRCKCDKVQGYFYSKPVPEHNVWKLL